jgi:hypothetical protein
MKWLALVIGILGVLLGVVAIVYLTVPAHSLPSMLGPLPHVNAHRVRRGEAAAVGAVALLLVAVFVGVAARRSQKQATPGPVESS